MDTVNDVPRAPVTRYTRVEDLPTLLNVDEACAWLDCERDHVYKLVAAKKLKAMRLGRLIRISRSALEQMVQGQ